MTWRMAPRNDVEDLIKKVKRTRGPDAPGFYKEIK